MFLLPTKSDTLEKKKEEDSLLVFYIFSSVHLRNAHPYYSSFDWYFEFLLNLVWLTCRHSLLHSFLQVYLVHSITWRSWSYHWDIKNRVYLVLLETTYLVVLQEPALSKHFLRYIMDLLIFILRSQCNFCLLSVEYWVHVSSSFFLLIRYISYKLWYCGGELGDEVLDLWAFSNESMENELKFFLAKVLWTEVVAPSYMLIFLIIWVLASSWIRCEVVIGVDWVVLCRKQY